MKSPKGIYSGAFLLLLILLEPGFPPLSHWITTTLGEQRNRSCFGPSLCSSPEGGEEGGEKAAQRRVIGALEKDEQSPRVGRDYVT